MVRIRNLLFYTVFMLWSIDSIDAQIIRKDHREMTPSEKNTYVQALTANVSFLQGEATHHSNHFNTEIHTTAGFNGTQFASWHRLFILEVEAKLRRSFITNADKITIPYWDWTAENDVSNISWDDNNFLDVNVLNNAGFGISRGNMTNGGSLANVGSLSSLQNLNSFMPTSPQNASSTSSFFSKRLEHWHNAGHTFIGGTMGTFTSPRDPIFYLHHNFVDKLWQDWEDKENSIKSSFPTPPAGINDWPGTSPNSITDSRRMKVNLTNDASNSDIFFEVRFASNKKLLLDGLNGDFKTSNTDAFGGIGRPYCYVAWNGSSVEGTIYAGDVQRDGSDNVVADNKGGFIVDADADFSAGSAIELLPGFTVLNGATFTAQIVDRPCGFSSNGFTSNDNDDVASLKASNSTAATNGMGKIYPNPFGDALNVAYEVDEDTPLSIQLVNALGQTIWQQNFGIQSKGAFQTTIPTTDLAKGLYTVLIKTNTGQKVFKAIH